ncbi:MAG: hypothetical protein QOG30_1815 [Acidimicrobiaceae bacterium]
MQPSSAGSGPERGSNLRRYGPIIGIVVVIAIIGAVVLLAGGDDKKTTATSSGSSSASGAVALPTGAIPFSQKGNRTDLTFSDKCDLTTGRLKMPYFYAPECFANVADNGGATAKGVTKDTITVVVYLAPDTDPIIDFITAPIKNDDNADTDQATYEGYTQMFNEYFQTYGRKVVLKFLHGSGTADNEVQARADAVKAVEELGAFAVWGGPILSPAWTDEIKARGVICLGCPDIKEPAPVVFPITPSNEQTNLQVAEYVTKKLNGKPAQFAGDDAFKTKTRTFGHVYQNSPGSGAEADAAVFKKTLSDNGVTLTEQVSYSLADLVNSPEVATNVVSKLKAAGVTTVLLQPDPIAPKSFTEEATKQNYFPEWVDAAGTLIDTAAFGRTYDQKQWAHMFGISFLAARVKREVADKFDLFTWYTGKVAPSEGSGVLFPRPGLFFAGLQAAGPNLTADSFRQGLFFGAPSDARSLTAPGITYGNHGLYPGRDDYYGIDDFVEVWWDPNATGPDEVRKDGKGLIQFVDGGKRYRLGEWTSDLKVFDPAGAVTLYDDIPAAEKPKEYPSPNATITAN